MSRFSHSIRKAKAVRTVITEGVGDICTGVHMVVAPRHFELSTARALLASDTLVAEVLDAWTEQGA